MTATITKLPTPERPDPAAISRVDTAEGWTEMFADRIGFAATLVPKEDHEAMGIAIATTALELLVPRITDPAGWLSFINRYLVEAPDAPVGITRTIALRISEALDDTRSRALAEGAEIGAARPG
jgi:hypothetical protein